MNKFNVSPKRSRAQLIKGSKVFASNTRNHLFPHYVIKTIKKRYPMFQESFADAAVIVQNILNQPLSISETDKDITLLSAALSFNESGVPSSYLSQIMETFIIYQGPTETLIRELELLSEDLNSYL